MKAYIKPVLYYERFELSQHIADCAWELNQAQDTCGYKGDPDFGFYETMVIISDGKACNETNQQFYCYTNGSSGMRVFAS